VGGFILRCKRPARGGRHGCVGSSDGGAVVECERVRGGGTDRERDGAEDEGERIVDMHRTAPAGAPSPGPPPRSFLVERGSTEGGRDGKRLSRCNLPSPVHRRHSNVLRRLPYRRGVGGEGAARHCRTGAVAVANEGCAPAGPLATVVSLPTARAARPGAQRRGTPKTAVRMCESSKVDRPSPGNPGGGPIQHRLRLTTFVSPSSQRRPNALQPLMRSPSQLTISSCDRRVCSMVSRSRMVTVPCSIVSPSMVMQNGVPASSWRR
jgi:hypothetical protein